MEISLEWEKGESPADFQDSLDEFVDAIEEEFENEWDDFAATFRKRTQQNAPVDTGRLRDSYEEMVEWITRHVLEGSVESKIPYAAFQEFIYTPHIAPAMASSKDDFQKHCENAWNRAVKRVS